jgi:transposase-like protein
VAARRPKCATPLVIRSRRAEMERDILKKATAYFAEESL